MNQILQIQSQITQIQNQRALTPTTPTTPTTPQNPPSLPGKCGPAATTWSSGAGWSRTDNSFFCAQGQLSVPFGLLYPTYPSPGSSTTWTCSGVNCVAYARPLVINGVCGPAAKYYSYAATGFEGNFCSAGTIGPDTGFATDDESSFGAAPPRIPGPGDISIWFCDGINGGYQIRCQAGREPSPPPVDGQCGTAIGEYPSTAKSFDGPLCAQGMPTNWPAFPSPGMSVAWYCDGRWGGSPSGLCKAWVQGMYHASKDSNSFSLLEEIQNQLASIASIIASLVQQQNKITLYDLTDFLI